MDAKHRYSASTRPDEADLLLHASIRRLGATEFLELDGRLLATTQPLEFDVFHHLGDQVLRRLFREGQTVPEDVQNQARRGKPPRNLFLRIEQREQLLMFMDKVVGEQMFDRQIDAALRYRAVVDLTTRLSADLFDKPNSIKIYRQRENARRVHRLMVEEPESVRGLLGLLHHQYAPHLHSANVGLIGTALTVELFSRQASTSVNPEALAEAYFLHDVGKSRISPEILGKKGPLLKDEWEEVKRHPDYGWNLLDREQQLSREIELVVLQHHERLDGLGYPQGLAGKRVHPYARICHLAEAFNALTTERPYKSALPPFQALQVMKTDMYDQFDPSVFRALVLMLRRHESENLAGEENAQVS